MIVIKKKKSDSNAQSPEYMRPDMKRKSVQID